MDVVKNVEAREPSLTLSEILFFLVYILHNLNGTRGIIAYRDSRENVVLLYHQSKRLQIIHNTCMVYVGSLGNYLKKYVEVGC